MPQLSRGAGRLGWSPRTAAGAAAAALTCGWALSSDASADAAAALTSLRWSVVAAGLLLMVLAAAHYASAAWSLRAVSGRPLPWWPTLKAQLAAAAVNRLVPGGVGGMALNARYLRRAGLSAGAATSALTALSLVGGVTDAGYVAVVTTVGPLVGLTGAAAEVRALARGGLSAGRHDVWLLLVVAIAVGVLVVVRRRPHAGVGAGRRLRAALTEAVGHSVLLLRRPGRLAAAALASTMTTVAMSVAFVLAVDTWGQAATPLPAGALIAVYLVAVTAGGALPPVCCITEATLVAALTLAGYHPASALLAVALVRLVTYWLPLPVGLWAGRRLRAAQVL